MTLFYRAATIGFVYLFKPILKQIWPEEAHMLAKVNWKGEYVRVIDNQKNVGDAVSAYPEQIAYEGSISTCAIEKLSKGDNTYRPPNIDL